MAPTYKAKTYDKPGSAADIATDRKPNLYKEIKGQN